MAAPEGRRTAEGFRRLISFADAVVAIALTLLVLPLAEIGKEIGSDTTVVAVFRDHSSELLGFLISFFVIWVLWRNHHRMIEYFDAYDKVLFNLHMVWLFTIVVLPFATSLISGPTLKWGTAFYIAVLLVSVSSLVAISEWGRRHRELLAAGQDVDEWVASAPDIGTVIALVVALVGSLVVPQWGSWWLVVLFLAGPADKIVAAVAPRR